MNLTKFGPVGAVAGDIIGSVYEIKRIKTTVFPLFTEYSTFTDDTVLTIAIADAILNNKPFDKTLHEYGNRYPDRGYGKKFFEWLQSPNPRPYNSWGNGSAMRVSPVGFAYRTIEEVLEKAKKSALPTHNHIEGIKGAQAVAAAVFLAKNGVNKKDIKDYIEKNFGYNLNRKIEEIRPFYSFKVSCQETVPEAIIAFLESSDFESAIRLGISLGGDSDTIGAITGAIASAYYNGVPEYIVNEVEKRLPLEFIKILNKFAIRFI